MKTRCARLLSGLLITATALTGAWVLAVRSPRPNSSSSVSATINLLPGPAPRQVGPAVAAALPALNPFDSATGVQVGPTYGRLPMQFEANRGQTDPRVRFISRGSGYTLFLTPQEAVLRLQKPEGAAPAGEATESFITSATTPALIRNPQSSVVRLKLVGSNTRPQVAGLEELTGRSHYLTGSDSRHWRTNVPGYARVRYESAWPGIDVVWYGNQRQLEHDFILAPGADPRRIRLSVDGSQTMNIDDQGALVLRTAGGDVRLLKPSAWQEEGGRRREVACHYRLDERQQVEFELGAYDPGKSLVIDPVLVYSTYLGGTGTEQGLGIAVDKDGNAYLAGSTTSTDFPGPGPIQQGKGAGTASDAFVLKLNPAGTQIVYATYLGGGGSDSANSIAVDAAGNAFITGATSSTDFPTTAGAYQRTLGGAFDAFVAKINPGGSALAYSTFVGGDYTDQAFGIALDSGGNAYLTGQTDSTNFPTAGSISSRHGNALFSSPDGGSSWNVGGSTSSGLPVSSVRAVTVDPSNTQVIYAIAGTSLFKSTDGGAGWQLASSTPPVSGVQPGLFSLAIDPKNTSTIYLGSASAVYKSANGGTTLEPKSTGLPSAAILSLVIDPITPATLYVGLTSGVYKSTNGGDSWAPANNGLSGTPGGGGAIPTVAQLAIDPTTPSTLYAATSFGLFKTTNGGGTWLAINSGINPFGGSFQATAVVVDPKTPTTLYAGAGTSSGVVFKSIDGGTSWQASDSGMTITIGSRNVRFVPTSLAVNAVTPSTIYASTPQGVFRSTDGGANWGLSNGGLTTRNIVMVAPDPASATKVYAAASAGSDAFVTKLNAAGSALAYSMYAGGDENDFGRAVAVDGAGNAWVTGQTASANFPTVNPLQAALGGISDVFVSKVNAAGSAFSFSTFLGGPFPDQGNAVALDGSGNVYVAGWTNSPEFPTVNPLYNTLSGTLDAFVTKIKADNSAIEYSTYLGGIGSDQAFGLAVDGPGNAYVTGVTGSQDFPAVSALQQYAGGDAFVTKLNPAGSKLLYSTFLGGFGNDQGNSIAFDSAGNAYVVGNTTSPNFPTVNPVQTFKGSDAFVAKLGPAADLSITMTDSPDPVVAGGKLTYSISVKNNGETDATGVTVSDTLPAGATVISTTASQGSCNGSGPVVCNLGSLSNGATATITIVINPPAQTTITNMAEVRANEADPDKINNTASVQTQVSFADLSVSNTTAYDRATPGSRITWLVTANNIAGIATTDVTLNFTLPPETTFVSCNAEGGACGGAGNNRIVTFGTLAVGETKSVSFSATVNDSVAGSTVITTTATIGPDASDPNKGNNTSSASVTVVTTDLIRPKANGKIVFSSDRAFSNSTQPSGIYTISPDGTGEQFLQATANEAYVPAWSPDGSKIAYQAYNNSGSGDAIYVINADGTNKIRVATNPGLRTSRISWSPDGKKIAYSGSGSFIYIASSDGSGAAKLPGSPDRVTDPQWSPDGSKIAYSRDGNVYVMNPDCSEQRKLTNGTDINRPFAAPRWSPDGSRLLVSGPSHVYLINVDGSGLTRLLNVSISQTPAWSPDGTKIVFVGGNYTLNVINFDGTGLVKIVDNKFYNFFPDWQPLPTNTPTPPLPSDLTYTITGKVTVQNGGIFTDFITLSGTRAGSVKADADNEGKTFQFVRLPRGGSYTITPVSATHRFEPPSRTYDNLQSDQAGADFTAIFEPRTISGRITDASGTGIAGVTVLLFGNSGSGVTAETDGGGNYAFTGLYGGIDYTVTPLSYATPDLYDPRSIRYTALDGDKTANFVGLREKFTLSGKVTDGSGGATSGVTIALAGGNSNLTTTTGNAGEYSFADLPGGFNYTVTASKSGATISPPTRNVILNRPKELNFYSAVSQATPVSAASYNAQAVATGGIVALFGTGLATSTKEVTGSVLPSELDGVSVLITVRNTVDRQCQLFFVSPQQINFLLPVPFTPSDEIYGDGIVTVKRDSRVVAAGSLRIDRVAPSLFAADASGGGPAAALALRVKADNTQVYEPIARYDDVQKKFVAVPVDLSNPAEQVFLVLFGTGIRLRSDLSAVTVKLGGEDATVTYAGIQPNFYGLDQVNVLIPRSLSGRGEVDIRLTVDGKAANTLRFNAK